MRADVVQIAPDVSGPVASVAVKDNQWVNRGDVLYSIDPRWLKLAVSSARAEVEARRRRWRCARCRQTTGADPGVISSEDLKQTNSAASVAAANYRGAMAALALAQLNLAHATVRTPVAGTSPICGYARATMPPPVTKVAIIDGQRFWVVGYFEETRLRHIHVGDTAHITLMGYDPVITGHVESIGHGSAIPMMRPAPGPAGGRADLQLGAAGAACASAHPYRYPARGVERVAGLSAAISVIPARLARRAGKSSPAGANQAQ